MYLWAFVSYIVVSWNKLHTQVVINDYLQLHIKYIQGRWNLKGRRARRLGGQGSFGTPNICP